MTGILTVVGGTALITMAWFSMLRTVFIPRRFSSRTARWTMRALAATGIAVARQLPGRTAGLLLDFCAPLSLFVMVICWLLSLASGFAMIGCGLGVVDRSLLSRFFTLRLDGTTAAALGMLAVLSATLALLAFVTYLSRFSDGYSRRERSLARLATALPRRRTAEFLLAGALGSDSLDGIDRWFAQWADWLTDIQSTHLSCPSLIYARPAGSLSWPTATILVMDAAALVEAIAPSRASEHSRRLLSCGSACLRELADRMGIELPAVTVSLQGREESGFSDTVRIVVGAGLAPERSGPATWAAFQRARTGYAPLATAIGGRLMDDMGVADSR